MGRRDWSLFKSVLPPPPLALSLVQVPSSSLRLYKAPCDTSSSAGKSTRSERERRGQLYPLHALTLFLRFYSAPSRLISRYRTSSSGDLIYLFSLVSGNNRSSTYATHVWVCVCAVQHTAATCVTWPCAVLYIQILARAITPVGGRHICIGCADCSPEE